MKKLAIIVISLSILTGCASRQIQNDPTTPVDDIIMIIPSLIFGG